MRITIPANTQMIFDEIEKVSPLYASLCQSDQLILDDIFDSVIQHKANLANAGIPFTFELMLLLMLLEQRKRIDNIHNELFQAIQKISAEIHSQLQIKRASSTD